MAKNKQVRKSRKPKHIEEKIKVGAVWYKVKEVVFESDEGCVGRCYPNQCLIEIEKRLPLDRKIQTLWHEIEHAIENEYQLKLSERKIDILGTAHIQVLQDNPNLRRL